MRNKVTQDHNFNTQNRFLDLESLIIDMLPHGSGIDGQWVVQQNQSRMILAHNSFTCYTEHGMVDGYVDFRVKIQLVNMELHIVAIEFERKHQYLAKKHDLRDYLESIFFDPAHLQDIAVASNQSVNIATHYG